MKVRVSPAALLTDRRRIFLTLGMILLAISGLLMYGAVQKAQQRSPAVIAARDLPYGKVISENDLETILVDLANSKNIYISEPNQLIGQTLNRNILAQEFFTASTITQDLNLRTLALDIKKSNIPPDLKINDQVDIWWIDPETNLAMNLLQSINTAGIEQSESSYADSTTLIISIKPSLVEKILTASISETIKVVKHEN